MSQSRSNFDESIKEKANSRVMEFLNEFKPKVEENYFKTFKSIESNKDTNNAIQEEEEQKDEYTRDDNKWKYNKQELLERKKKLLKDKTNFKK